MPAKRSSSKLKDQHAAAKTAVIEAQRVADELLRKKAEDEEASRIRAEEESNQRALEEEHRLSEDEKRKEEDMQRSKSIEERRIREKEREIQQIQLLEEKDKEINDLKEKLYALNKTLAAVQYDLESETRRAAKLNNELEIAQMRLIDGDSLMERRGKEWAASSDMLRDENQSLSVNLKNIDEQSQKLESENRNLHMQLGSDTELLRTEVVQMKTTRERDDAENTVLLKMLHAELDKYKQTVSSLQCQIENKDRDDIKNTIMLGLLNSQLDTMKEENHRLFQTVDSYQCKINALETKVEDVTHRIVDTTADREQLARDTSKNETHLLREIDVHRSQVNTLTAQLEKMNMELESTKGHFLTYQQDSDRRDKEAFETNILLKAELEHTKKQHMDLIDEKKSTDDKYFQTNVTQTAENDSLKMRIQKMVDHSERTDKEMFETTTVLNVEVETLKAKMESSNEQMKTSEKDNFEKITGLKRDLDQERNAHTQSKHIAERKEKEYFEQLTRITADHDSLHRQVLHHRTQQEKRDKEYVENTVLLNSEKENLKNKIVLLEETIEKLIATHDAYANNIHDEHNALQRKMDECSALNASELRTSNENTVEARQLCEAQQKRIGNLETEHSIREKDNWDRINGYKAEAQSLKAEMEGARQAIEKLEGSIAENYNYKILAEQNETLKSDLQFCRNQVVNLNNTVATMKIESDILDNYKTKILQEQNDQYVRRIQQQEKEHRMVSPLMNEMIDTLQRHGLTASLQADIDQYRQQATRAHTASAAIEDNVSMKASAMGRKELSSLNTVHV